MLTNLIQKLETVRSAFRRLMSRLSSLFGALLCRPLTESELDEQLVGIWFALGFYLMTALCLLPFTVK